ncbi:hypothetical protein FACS1894159_04560 [Bacteroidia bacterium]|nr:hypothetical protein FACS1894159_04560 [Bacteroidia bacterium]
MFMKDSNIAMNRIFATIGAVCALPLVATAQQTRPNVLIIQTDDLGYDDLGIHGQKVIQTPALNRLGGESVRFTNYYLHSVSSPSRASLLTGRHFWRTGVTGVHGGRDFMNLDEKTMAEYFLQAGYSTAMWGKWHSGKTDGYFPWQRGFEQAYMGKLYQHENPQGSLNGKNVTFPGQWSDAVCTDMAIEFLAQQHGKPFFAYLSFLSPHGIWAAPEEYRKRYADQGYSKSFSTLCGQIEHLDHQVGRLMDALEKNGLAKNTIVLFMSDNGPTANVGNISLTEQEWALRNPNAARGQKGSNWQNGIHSPFFVRYGDRYTAGENTFFVSICDVMPTLLDLCGATPAKFAKKIDGRSVAPWIEPEKGKQALAQGNLAPIVIAQWHPVFSDRDGILKGKDTAFAPINDQTRPLIEFDRQVTGLHRGYYKLLMNQRGEQQLVLTNLENDPHETENIASQHPKMVAEMQNELKRWFDDVYKNEDSFNMPTFQIGLEKNRRNPVLAYAPFRISSSLSNSQHELSGWGAKGDFAEYLVDVHTPGEYSIEITPKVAKTTASAVFTLSCGNSSTTVRAAEQPSIKLASGKATLRIELAQDAPQPFALTEIILIKK